MADNTELYLPTTLPYPIKVESLDVASSSAVERGTRLLSYSYAHIHSDPKLDPEKRHGTWECTVSGTLERWNVKRGDVVSLHKAKSRPAVAITEPCKHGVQIGGLCGLCGKDMTNFDYTGFSDGSRASIQMTHSAFGPTVSMEEAQKIERATADHLLQSRKLSLIVDLDQTIVHATVDPTVGDWIADGEAWESRQASKTKGKGEGSNTPKDEDSEDSDASSSESEDECNPNWDALKDVKKFTLGPDSFGPVRGSSKKQGKQRVVEEGAMYYIKPRPGWEGFLRDTATKYEMHVYTMGTRAYAEKVCAAIDPEGQMFGGRILSRDESGSLTQKSLQRLFPCDTSMVVIIDDRADVWEWSPNLLKVVPYDFFIGIGDINSTFLPKIQPLTASMPILPPSKKAAKEAPATLVDGSPTIEEVARVEAAKNALLTQNSLALEAQLEERPLAKKQQVADEEEAKHVEGPAPEAGRSTTPKPEKHHRKALLKNDDVELNRLSKLLQAVHLRFFNAWDVRKAIPESEKRKGKGRERPQPAHDVTQIIPQIRSDTLKGVHILFSSVIPLDTRPEATEIWRMAHMFGAECHTELSGIITHVVAAKRGTQKVDAARKRRGVKVVWLAWFTDSVALWERLDETSYLIDGPSSGGESPHEEDDAGVDSDDFTEKPGLIELGDVAWEDVNDEVDAAMMESDEEEEQGSGTKSVVMSGDESDTSASSTGTPKKKRKRNTSLTPSDSGINGSGNEDPEDSQSPLAKRKKIAASRSGNSRLKEEINVDNVKGKGVDLNGSDTSSVKSDDEKVHGATSAGPSQPSKDDSMREDEGSEEYEDEDDDDDDDFLLRELEADMG